MTEKQSEIELKVNPVSRRTVVRSHGLTDKVSMPNTRSAQLTVEMADITISGILRLFNAPEMKPMENVPTAIPASSRVVYLEAVTISYW